MPSPGCATALKSIANMIVARVNACRVASAFLSRIAPVDDIHNEC
jgi:hypothetical protein